MERKKYLTRKELLKLLRKGYEQMLADGYKKENIAFVISTRNRSLNGVDKIWDLPVIRDKQINPLIAYVIDTNFVTSYGEAYFLDA